MKITFRCRKGARQGATMNTADDRETNRQIDRDRDRDRSRENELNRHKHTATEGKTVHRGRVNDKDNEFCLLQHFFPVCVQVTHRCFCCFSLVFYCVIGIDTHGSCVLQERNSRQTLGPQSPIRDRKKRKKKKKKLTRN